MTEYIPLLTAVVGVSGTLIAVWVTNVYNNRRFTEQLAFDKEKENKKLLLSKAEDLHLALTSWDKSVVNYQACQLDVIKGVSSQQEFHQFLSEFANQDIHDRLETALYLYFPDLSHHMKDIQDGLIIGNRAYERFLQNMLSLEQAKAQHRDSIMKVGQSFKALKVDLRNKTHQLLQ